jgi:hypothetical protein
MRVAVVTNGQITMVQQADYTRKAYAAPAATKVKRVALPARRRRQPETMKLDSRKPLEGTVFENMQISHI